MSVLGRPDLGGFLTVWLSRPGPEPDVPGAPALDPAHPPEEVQPEAAAVQLAPHRESRRLRAELCAPVASELTPLGLGHEPQVHLLKAREGPALVVRMYPVRV